MYNILNFKVWHSQIQDFAGLRTSGKILDFQSTLSPLVRVCPDFPTAPRPGRPDLRPLQLAFFHIISVRTRNGLISITQDQIYSLMFVLKLNSLLMIYTLVE